MFSFIVTVMLAFRRTSVAPFGMLSVVTIGAVESLMIARGAPFLSVKTAAVSLLEASFALTCKLFAVFRFIGTLMLKNPAPDVVVVAVELPPVTVMIDEASAEPLTWTLAWLVKGGSGLMLGRAGGVVSGGMVPKLRTLMPFAGVWSELPQISLRVFLSRT